MTIQDPDSARAYGRDLLVGELVRLRPLEERDLVHLDRWWNEPEWQPFLQRTVRPQPDGGVQDGFRSTSTNGPGGDVGFGVEALSSGEFVGHVALRGIALPARTATLGVVVGPTFVGRGYGSDAIRVAARYGFRSVGVHRVEMTLAAFDHAGRSAAEQAGFQVEGVRRQAAFLDGAYVDELHLGLLPEDFAAAERAAGSPS